MVSSDLLLVFSYHLGDWVTWGKLLSDMARQKTRATRGRSIHLVSRIGSASPPTYAAEPWIAVDLLHRGNLSLGQKRPWAFAPSLGRAIWL